MKKLYALIMVLALTQISFGQVFITELADPNNASGARYVELYNAGTTAVDLSTGWDLQRWTNGNTSPQSPVELTGTIPAGGFYIVCANQATFTSTYGIAASQEIGTGGPADSNGDDQIALRDNTDAIVDMFGVVGEDGSGTNHEFEDGRAERKATVTAGNATYTFAEWNIWNDTGGDGTTNDPQDAPGAFDPGSWIGASTGSDNPPSISNVSRDKIIPLASEDLTVTADITDDNGLTDESLIYTIDGGTEITVAMTNTSGDTYSGVIPNSAYSNENLLEYWVSATDDNSQTTVGTHSKLLVGTASIGKVRTNDANGYPVYKGAAARVSGVCTAESGVYSSSSIDVFIQDATGGIDIYKGGAGADFTFIRGNNYTVIGSVEFYNGKTEITPFDATTDITDDGVSVMPDLQVLTIAELSAAPEDFEGELVGIVSVTMISGTWPASGNANLTITDNNVDELTLRIDGDTNIPGADEPVWPRDLIGIFIQYDSSSPYSDGYQILPRDTNDIKEANTVPVELTSFSANVSGMSVELSWETATETNNSGFEIQRSSEGKNWSKIGFIEGNNGTEIHRYTFTDNLTIAGVYNYRLKQIDLDGTYEFSSEIEVNLNAPINFELEQNFPNPFNPTTNIRFSIPNNTDVSIRVFNALGQEAAVVFNGNLSAGIHTFAFNASELTSGIYYYRIKAGNFVDVKKMILLK